MGRSISEETYSNWFDVISLLNQRVFYDFAAISAELSGEKREALLEIDMMFGQLDMQSGLR